MSFLDFVEERIGSSLVDFFSRVFIRMKESTEMSILRIDLIFRRLDFQHARTHVELHQTPFMVSGNRHNYSPSYQVQVMHSNHLHCHHRFLAGIHSFPGEKMSTKDENLKR